ncbi:MAG: phage portal protein [Anaerolineae bacterium]|nr:phage portal protein [Anaerolineae bacterium]
MDKPSFFDRALLAVAPGIAAARARSQREYLQHQKATSILRSYDGASKDRRNDGWRRPGTSARAEISVGGSMLRNSARELVRNNGNAANAVNVLETNVIGTGIRPGFDANTDAAERQLREMWEEYVESEASGADEVGNFYARQGLGFRAIVESGSVLLRRRRRRSERLAMPYQVQVLEPDFLDASKLESTGNKTIIGGKEFNNQGEVVAYWLYTAHPGDALIGTRRAFHSTRVLANEVSHAFRIDRPGQVDGASWFAPVMTTLRDLADTRDAYQLRQKIAACFTVFIHESEPGAGTTYAGQPTTDHIEPGRVESIPPGKEVTFAKPPGVDGLSDFDRAQLLTIASGLGMPYEALTGDLRNVNFLSGRMGWLGFYRNIDSWRTKIVIPRLCKPELTWFLDGAALKAGINQPVRVTWTAPHRDLLDPTKEIKALREEMRLGAMAYPDMVRMRGRDPNQVIDAWEKWDKELKKRDLFFDWNPRMVSMAGNSNDVNEGDSNDSSAED